MGSRQDAALAELRAAGGAMWQDDLLSLRRSGRPTDELCTRPMKGLERAGVITRTRVPCMRGSVRSRTWVRLVPDAGLPWPPGPPAVADAGEGTGSERTNVYECGRSRWNMESASDRVLDVLLERGSCTTAELAKAVDMDRDAVRRALRSLRRWGLATVTGERQVAPDRFTTELVFAPTEKAEGVAAAWGRVGAAPGQEERA